MDYKKKSLKKLNLHESYEEIDTRLATGWYVDSVGSKKEKKYKTKEISYKISKKNNWLESPFEIIPLIKTIQIGKWHYMPEM